MNADDRDDLAEGYEASDSEHLRGARLSDREVAEVVARALAVIDNATEESER